MAHSCLLISRRRLPRHLHASRHILAELDPTSASAWRQLDGGRARRSFAAATLGSHLVSSDSNFQVVHNAVLWVGAGDLRMDDAVSRNLSDISLRLGYSL
jgi:hypothetical protein